MKLILFLVAIFLLVIFVPLTAYSLTLPSWICENIELEYTIENGQVLELCYDENDPMLRMEVNMTSDGSITMKVPRSMIYSLSQDCNSHEIFILGINEEWENNVNIEETPKNRIITTDLPQGQYPIEIFGTYTLDVRIHDYCGVIYGYASKYLPPLKQTNNGISSKGVMCNDGLELILKITDDSPACVKPHTAEKLIELGWGIKL